MLSEYWYANPTCADQSRKRGILESDLVLSTFATANLASMTEAQLDTYDRFLDENDWDIYYWATQEEPSTDTTGVKADAEARGSSGPKDETQSQPLPTSKYPGEWAQTVGAFKAAYRPVPSRWRDSEILRLLRAHVVSRRSVGVEDKAKRMGFMPPLEAAQ